MNYPKTYLLNEIIFNKAKEDYKTAIKKSKLSENYIYT